MIVMRSGPHISSRCPHTEDVLTSLSLRHRAATKQCQSHPRPERVSIRCQLVVQNSCQPFITSSGEGSRHLQLPYVLCPFGVADILADKGFIPTGRSASWLVPYQQAVSKSWGQALPHSSIFNRTFTDTCLWHVGEVRDLGLTLIGSTCSSRMWLLNERSQVLGVFHPSVFIRLLRYLTLLYWLVSLFSSYIT